MDIRTRVIAQDVGMVAIEPPNILRNLWWQALPPNATLERPSNDDDNKSNECSPIEVESYSPISNCIGSCCC